MQIRRLTIDELPLLNEIGDSFFAEGEIPGGFKLDVFKANWANLINQGIGAMFGGFNEDNGLRGALGAVRCPDINNNQIICIENFWYVLPKYRTGWGIRLVKAFEAWAKDIGAARVGMIHLLKLTPGPLGELYQRMGYRPIEVNYIKELT